MVRAWTLRPTEGLQRTGRGFTGGLTWVLASPHLWYTTGRPEEELHSGARCPGNNRRRLGKPPGPMGRGVFRNAVRAPDPPELV